MKFWSNSDIPSHGTFVPEKRLLAAVLQRAITDFITGDGELKEGSRLWLLEDESCSDAPLSFRFICEALDLDLGGLKKAIFIQESAQAEAVKVYGKTTTGKAEAARPVAVSEVARIVGTTAIVSPRTQVASTEVLPTPRTSDIVRTDIVRGEFIVSDAGAQALH